MAETEARLEELRVTEGECRQRLAETQDLNQTIMNAYVEEITHIQSTKDELAVAAEFDVIGALRVIREMEGRLEGKMQENQNLKRQIRALTANIL